MSPLKVCEISKTSHRDMMILGFNPINTILRFCNGVFAVTSARWTTLYFFTDHFVKIFIKDDCHTLTVATVLVTERSGAVGGLHSHICTTKTENTDKQTPWFPMSSSSEGTLTGRSSPNSAYFRIWHGHQVLCFSACLAKGDSTQWNRTSCGDALMF